MLMVIGFSVLSAFMYIKEIDSLAILFGVIALAALIDLLITRETERLRKARKRSTYGSSRSNVNSDTNSTDSSDNNYGSGRYKHSYDKEESGSSSDCRDKQGN